MYQRPRDGAGHIVCAARDAKGYDFCVAISEKQQAKLAFRIGDVVKGTGWTPLYPKCEFADLYRAGGLKVVERAAGEIISIVEANQNSQKSR